MARAHSWTPSTRSASSVPSTPVRAMPGATSPDIGLWKPHPFLRKTLLPLLSEDSSKATKIAEAALSGYRERFGGQYIARFRAKFGLPPEAPVELIKECLDLLGTQAVDFHSFFFRQLTRVRQRRGFSDACRDVFAVVSLLRNGSPNGVAKPIPPSISPTCALPTRS